MTTDAGVDLVTYSPRNKRAYTIQVKTQEKPTPGGGKWKLAIGWYLNEVNKGDLDYCNSDSISKILSELSLSRDNFLWQMYLKPPIDGHFKSYLSLEASTTLVWIRLTSL